MPRDPPGPVHTGDDVANVFNFGLELAHFGLLTIGAVFEGTNFGKKYFLNFFF